MKEALFYEKLEGTTVRCQLCPHKCIIANKKRGICGVRENRNGKLYSLVYGRPAATNLDPIEKKPLYHFLPATLSFSLGTVGCNLSCRWCQNYDISKADPYKVDSYEMLPEEIIQLALRTNSASISYTYTEPTIFYEMVYETSRLAHTKGLKNVIVSNGFINKEPLIKLSKYIDAANIDIKSYSDDVYIKYCGARLEPVINTIITLRKQNVWVELTYLLIPEINDDFEQFRELCKLIESKLGRDVPFHISRFFPMYKMSGHYPTPESELLKAYQIAKEFFDFVYVGNINLKGFHDTVCPNCGASLIERTGYSVKTNFTNGKCKCGYNIPGVWQ